MTFTISAWNVYDNLDQTFGPFEYVQITREWIRVPEPGSEDTLDIAHFEFDDGLWYFTSPKFIATDFILSSLNEGV